MRLNSSYSSFTLGCAGTQAILPVAGLPVCQVHPHRGAPAGDGGPGGAAEAAGAGGDRGQATRSGAAQGGN